MRKVLGVSAVLFALSAALWAVAVVGANLRVSAVSTTNNRYTSDIRMFPGDLNQLLVASESSSGRQIQSRTLDGGAT